MQPSGEPAGTAHDIHWSTTHEDVRPWKRFPHYWLFVKGNKLTIAMETLSALLNYWPFVKGIHRWPMDSPHKAPVIVWFCICCQPEHAVHPQQTRCLSHIMDLLWEKFRWILPLYMKPISFQSKASVVRSVTAVIFVDFCLKKLNVFSQNICKKTNEYLNSAEQIPRNWNVGQLSVLITSWDIT